MPPRLLPLLCLLLCSSLFAQQKKGYVEKLSPALDEIVDADARITIIADSLDWCEGPVWIESAKMLLFSDVPQNIIYKWTATAGKQPYLSPSGYTGTTPRGGEKGSNGLTLNAAGRLVICQDGDRCIAIMDAPLQTPRASFRILTHEYKNKKFNSPNDLVYNRKGELFFTDPPYGLEKNMDDPLKELPFQGVYKLKPSGELVLLLDSLTRPNGIAITPDQKTLMIANSDPQKAYWYAFDIGENDHLSNGRIFYDAGTESRSFTGLPDGMKIDSKGNVFATGPGGVWIFTPKGQLAGKIRFEGVTSNCTLTADEKTLFITADMYVLRVRLRK